MVKRIAIWAALLGLAGCSVVVSDLNDLETDQEACAPGGEPDSFRTFSIQLEGMTPHARQRIVFNLVSNTGALQSRVVVEDLPPSGSFFFDVPNAVHPNAATLEFWADSNQDYQPGPVTSEHQWIRPLCEDGEIYFEHVFEFEDLSAAPITVSGLDFRASFPDFAQALQSPITITVERTTPPTTATVGFYYLASGISIPRTGFVRIPGIIDAGSPHRAILVVQREGMVDIRCTIQSDDTTEGFIAEFSVDQCTGPLPAI